MAKYLLGVNHAKQNKTLFRLKIIVLLIGAVGVVFGIVVFVDIMFERRLADKPSDKTPLISSVIAPKIAVFSSPYFKFQTDNNWSFISSESSDLKFVYRRGTSNLVSGIMTVYINSSPSDLQSTRVLPVSLSNKDNLLKASFVSKHCREDLPKKVQDTLGEFQTTLLSVNFLCNVDGTTFDVIVGLENATPVMNLKRADGSTASYIIMFKDLRFKAEPSEFVDIINSFQIR